MAFEDLKPAALRKDDRTPEEKMAPAREMAIQRLYIHANINDRLGRTDVADKYREWAKMGKMLHPGQFGEDV